MVILDSNTEDEMEVLPILLDYAQSNSSKGSVNTADDEFHGQRKPVKRPRLTMEDSYPPSHYPGPNALNVGSRLPMTNPMADGNQIRALGL